MRMARCDHAPILPLETYLMILPVAYIGQEMAGLRLRCGEAF